MKEIERYDGLKVPDYAMSYLVNGDSSGIEDEDQKNIDNWYNWYVERAKELDGYVIFSEENVEQESYFSSYPEFGLACSVVDCIILIVK